MKKLYLYIRLSDADDDLKFKTESESIANQRTLLYRFIRARREFDGYEVVEFIDDGYSGTNGNRPSFERMIESLKNGEANVVICKDFSRFFRDYVEIGDYLERIFPFLGVRFIAVNDGYDSDDYKGSTAGMEVVMKYIVYSYPENALVPYPVIVAATKGDPDAMKIVLQHFSGYIARLSMRKLYDERGNVYFGVDHDIRERLQAKLMMAVLTFKAEE